MSVEMVADNHSRHHLANSEQIESPSSVPAQQHYKPALGLLVPQEVYNYEPSPTTSPVVECPVQPTESSAIDAAHQGPSPLHKYLNKPENGELLALGLPSSNMALEQLSLPVTATCSSIGVLPPSSSTKGWNWDMIELGAPASDDPIYTDNHVNPHRECGKSTLSLDWIVVESPSTIDVKSATALDPTPARDVLPQTIHPDASMSHCNDIGVRRSRMGSLVTQADLEVDPLVDSTNEPPVGLAEAYLQGGRRNRSSRSSSQVSHPLWSSCKGADSL